MSALLLGWVGTVLVVSFNVPQVWRTCVRGRTTGVPASRAWVAIAVAVVWLGYGLDGGGTVQIILNATTISLNVLLLVGLGAVSERGGLILVLFATVATVALGNLSGKQAVGVVGAVLGSGVYLPQLLALRRSGAVDGVSVVALALQLSGGFCWLAYGLVRAETVVWVPNVFVLSTTVFTVALLGIAGRTAARCAPALHV